MARPRGRTSKPTSSAATASTKSTPLKRRAASPVTPLRQSKRINSTLQTPASTKTSTPKKSVYFEQDTEGSVAESESEIENEGSGYEDEEASAVSSAEPSADESEEYASEEDDVRRSGKAKKRGAGGRGKKMLVPASAAAAMGVAGKSAKDKELWKEGVKVEGEGEVFITLPRARSPGKTPYQDHTLHPNTLLFLGDLKRNNERAWLKVHDRDFRQSEKDWKSFVEAVTERLTEKDETIPDLPPKDLVFRIYRDVRFSSDPTPYKTHFSAAWSRTGRKGPYAAYYVQIAPGNSFVGGGLWCPEAEPLRKLRRAVDGKARKLKSVLRDREIRKNFFGGIKDDEKKVVKTFCEHNAENALKRHPKGYAQDHLDIELLRLRNYTIGRKLKDDEVLGSGGLGKVVDLLGTLTPFVTYLNGVVMPDPDQEHSNDDEDDSEEDGENNADAPEEEDDDDEEGDN